jgi:HAD superfamily hydrolase (TIGR01490 family)
MNGSHPSRTAAFFDLDGTLIEGPSLERRFTAWLRKRRAIPAANYFRWLGRAVQLAPQGFGVMRHANKMYLRGIDIEALQRIAPGAPHHSGSPAAEMSVPRFFRGGVDRMAWHAAQGHAIFLVTGTLEPLAREIGLALTIRLGVRGLETSVRVCATRLQQREGQWTGQILGPPIFGEAKACAVQRLSAKNGFVLERCYAYGNSMSDRWMLEAVGRAAAVNPSRRMEILARGREWPVLSWASEQDFPRRSPGPERREIWNAREAG